jgi:hypothetical protein
LNVLEERSFSYCFVIDFTSKTTRKDTHGYGRERN